MDQSKIEEEVWEAVQKLNRLWAVEGKADQLKDYFHKGMTAITPNDRMRLEGGTACVGAWAAFAAEATIHYWKEIDPKVDVFGDGRCAVVTYYYETSFDIGGRTMTTSGRDMLFMVNEDSRWWVVADQFSGYPAS